jgi:OPA family sugar phosphate sensor protein UhpC-like MFS transporter
MTAAALSAPARDPARALRHRLLVAITLGYGFSYIGRLALGVVKKPLIDQGIYSPATLGTMGSALFAGYAIAKLFNGFIADHVNVRLFIALGVTGSALCCFALGSITDASVATALAALNGIFQSFAAPGCIIAIAATYGNTDRGRAYGIWSTSHSIGEAITFLVLGAAVGALGWQVGFRGAAGFGLIAAGLILALMPRRLERREAKPDRARLFRAQLAVLKLWPVWLLGLASAASYVTRYGIDSWGILYLEEARGYGAAQAGTLLMAANLAGIAGSLALGYISDLLFGGWRPPANLLFGLCEVLGLLLLFFVPSPIALWAGMLVFGVGVGGVNASIGGLFAVDLAPPACVGAVMGMVGSFSYLGSAVQERVSGTLIQAGLRKVNGVNRYDFSGAIAFWIGAAVVSMLLSLLLWRRGKQGSES